MQIDRDAVQRVIDLLTQSQAGEIEVADGNMRISVRRSALIAASESAVEEGIAEGDVMMVSESTQAPVDAGARAEPAVQYVTAGLVGLFHHGRAPDAEPIVSVGEKVNKGDVIGTIEALRKLTDVVAPCDGVIAEVLVDDGEPVQYGDRLFAIRIEEG